VYFEIFSTTDCSGTPSLDYTYHPTCPDCSECGENCENNGAEHCDNNCCPGRRLLESEYENENINERSLWRGRKKHDGGEYADWLKPSQVSATVFQDTTKEYYYLSFMKASDCSSSGYDSQLY